MTLQASGQISMSDINVELSKLSTALISLNDTNVRTLAQIPTDQSTISLSNLYGKSAGYSSASISASTTSISYGTSISNRVTFTITPTPSIAGTLYFTINHITTSPDDFNTTTYPLSGSVTISGGTGTVIIDAQSYVTVPKTTESFQLLIRKDSTSGAVIGTSAEIFIVPDSTQESVTNISPTPPSYWNGVPVLLEGTSYTLTVSNASNTFSNTLYWKIDSSATDTTNGFENTDFTTLSGSVTFNAGIGYITITPTQDWIADYEVNNSEIGSISLYTDPSYTNLAYTYSLRIDNLTNTVPTYSLSVDPSSQFSEGQTVTFTLTASGIPIYGNTYNLNVTFEVNNNGIWTSSSTDFVSPPTSITIVNGTASFQVTAKRDFATEGTESFRLRLLDVTNLETSVAGVYNYVYFSVLDTTTALTMNTSTTSVTEGDSVVFTISAGSSNAVISWEIVPTFTGGVQAADFSTNSLTGTLNIINGSATFTLGTVDDWLTERVSPITQSFTFVLKADGATIATSPTITITDYTPTITVVPSSYAVNEGDTVTVTVTLSRPYNTTLYGWYTSNSNDITYSGYNIPIVDGVGTWTTTIVNDSTTEGTENVLRYQVYYETGRTTLLAQSTAVTVYDTSVFCNVAVSATSINEGDAVTFTFTNGPASGTYHVTLNSATTLSIFDFVIQDGIAYSSSTNYLATITFVSGSATLTVYTIADATAESTETSFSLDIRSTSATGTIVATTPTVTVTDQGTTTPAAWHFSTYSFATGTGNLTIDTTAANSNYFAILGEIPIGTVSDTTNDSGWVTAYVNGSLVKISYKSLTSADAGVVVSNLGSSNDRVMAHYFYKPGGFTSAPTVTVLASVYSTATGSISLTNTASTGVVLGSNEMGILFYTQYASGTSAATITSSPAPAYLFSNTSSTFQRSAIKVYQPGSKIPWQHTVSSTISGTTIRRVGVVLKLTW